jgi:hypothetical protein
MPNVLNVHRRKFETSDVIFGIKSDKSNCASRD